MSDLIDRQAALDTIMGQPPEPHYPSWYAAQIEKLPAAQPDHNADISEINKFIDGLEEILADIRERHVDDSVCGLCEYDGAYMGQSGDWCNECPGFDKDDCFKLSDETRKKWIEEIVNAYPDHTADISKKVSIPCAHENDLIFRQAAIDALKGLPTWWADEGGYYGGAQPPMVALLDPEDAVSAIENLPSAQPATNCSEIPNGSDDTISRRAAIDAMGKAKWAKERLMELPSVQPDHNADVSKKAEGDCISRQVVAKFFNDWISCLDENCHHQSVADMTIIKNDFKNLPSVQPKQVCVATVTLTDEQVKEAVEKAKNAVISVIEPEPHWIPCSEKLPEYNESVLTWDGYVFCIEKRIPYIRDDDGEPIEGDWWVSDEYDEYESEYYPNLRDGAAIAWMPLPDHYEGGDSE